jgi:transcriptional repressor NrdR
MQCPHCNNNVTKVIDSRPQDDNTRRQRRYECLHCKQRFTTDENYVSKLEKIALDNQMEIDELKELFKWLWRSIYAVSCNDSTVKDLRWNIENYTSQRMKAILRKYI